MKPEEVGDLTDLPSAIEKALLSQCGHEGRRFTAGVAAELKTAMENCRDPARKTELVNLLAKVEQLRDGEQLSFERERAP